MRRNLIVVALFLIGAGLCFFTGRRPPSVVQADHGLGMLSRKGSGVSKPEHEPFTQHLRRLEPELKSAIGRRVVPTVEDFMKGRMERLLNAQTQCYLTQSEREQLSERYAYYQSVRGAFELSVAEIQSDAFSLTAKIPSYPAAGAEIEARMKQDFRSVLGVDRGEALWNSMDSQLREDFAQFGRATQTVTATAGPSSDGGKIYRIKRQVEWTGPNGYPRSVGSDAMFLDRQIEETDFLYFAPLLGKIAVAPQG